MRPSPLLPADFVPADAREPAVPSTDPLAHLSPTVSRLRMVRYHSAVVAFDESSPERAVMRRRWRDIGELVADNPLRGAEAFLDSTAAGRRLAELANAGDQIDNLDDPNAKGPE